MILAKNEEEKPQKSGENKWLKRLSALLAPSHVADSASVVGQNLEEASMFLVIVRWVCHKETIVIPILKSLRRTAFRWDFSR